MYVHKAVRKGRTRDEVDRVICWLTGYTQEAMQQQIDRNTTFEEFFDQAPSMHPDCSLITGVVCGVRLETVDDPSSTSWWMSSRRARRWRKNSASSPLPRHATLSPVATTQAYGVARLSTAAPKREKFQ